VTDRRTGALVRHPGLREAGEAEQTFTRCNLQDLRDLDTSGFIRVETKKRRMPASSVGGRKMPPYTIESFEFAVTQKGFERIEGVSRISAGAGDQLPGLEWDADVRPVLEAAYALSGSSDPRDGVLADDVSERLGRDPTDPETGRVLLALAEAGYLVPTVGEVMGRIGPQAFRLGERALQILAGWPVPGSGDQFVKQLIAVLDEQIAGAQGEERSRLERLRDTLLGVGHDVFVAVLADAAKRVGGDLY
jgi:hypothetical protein